MGYLKMLKNITEKSDNLVFNAELKKKFLSESIESGTFLESTANNYLRIFIITKEFEERANKDLSLFTLKELEEVLIGFDSNSINTIVSYGRIISSYLHWCVDNGIIATNHLSALVTSDFEKYITNREVYFTESNLRMFEDSCTNYQDAVILRLLFTGVGGKRFAEISNLREEHVFWDRKELKLITPYSYDENENPLKFTERTISVDDRTLDLIKGAMKEKIYYKRNGEMKDHQNVRPYTDLIDNDYIVRPSHTKIETAVKSVSRYVIFRRIKMIADFLGMDELTAKYIQRSGVIYFVKELIGDANEIAEEDLRIVADRFDMRSHHGLKGYVTMDSIKRTYPNG